VIVKTSSSVELVLARAISALDALDAGDVEAARAQLASLRELAMRVFPELEGREASS
jgi:hypothetical protein